MPNAAMFDCQYAEYRKCQMLLCLIVNMLSIEKQSASMLIAIMMSVEMLSADMLIVNMLSIIMPNAAMFDCQYAEYRYAKCFYVRLSKC